MIRVAAVGDIHCAPVIADRIAASFSRVQTEADLVLLAGDLTTYGEIEQAAALAEACRGLTIPLVAVLGNHDWHCGRSEEVTEVLRDAGLIVLEREAARLRMGDTMVGIVGLKGFIGGFARMQLPDFGEPLLRQAYRQTSDDVDALDAGLREIADCDLRIVLLHYSPSAGTLVGEPPEIWTFLGNERLAGPLREHRPHLVLHGHGHAGTPFAEIAPGVAVHNVAAPLLEGDFRMFELPASERSVASG